MPLMPMFDESLEELLSFDLGWALSDDFNPGASGSLS